MESSSVASKKDYPKYEVAGYRDNRMEEQSYDGCDSHDRWIQPRFSGESRAYAQEPSGFISKRSDERVSLGPVRIFAS